jgi:hypothetical protein
LRPLRQLNSARVATWCCGTAGFPEGGTVRPIFTSSGQSRTARGPTPGSSHLNPTSAPPRGGVRSCSPRRRRPIITAVDRCHFAPNAGSATRLDLTADRVLPGVSATYRRQCAPRLLGVSMH